LLRDIEVDRRRSIILRESLLASEMLLVM